MNDKAKRLFVVLLVGWMLGYFHHFFAVQPELEELSVKASALEGKVMMLQANMNSITKVKVKATAYSNDRFSINVARWRDLRTATNTLARRGIVAADWRVFPPGTRLYIPGYGEAIVEDRGGAVKGYHIDLFVDSYKEALDWGVRELDVYVIEKGTDA